MKSFWKFLPIYSDDNTNNGHFDFLEISLVFFYVFVLKNTSMLIAISFSAYFRSIYCGYWPSQICFIFVTLLTISTNTPPKSIDCWKQCKSKNLANLSKNTPANVTGWFGNNAKVGYQRDKHRVMIYI